MCSPRTPNRESDVNSAREYFISARFIALNYTPFYSVSERAFSYLLRFTAARSSSTRTDTNTAGDRERVRAAFALGVGAARETLCTRRLSASRKHLKRFRARCNNNGVAYRRAARASFARGSFARRQLLTSGNSVTDRDSEASVAPTSATNFVFPRCAVSRVYGRS